MLFDIYINIRLNFYKIRFVLLFFKCGLLISCFENHMDNCQFVIFNEKIDTIKNNLLVHICYLLFKHTFF